LGAVFTVALAVGLRLGEALGPRWEDVDLQAGTLTVRQALQRIEWKLQFETNAVMTGRIVGRLTKADWTGMPQVSSATASEYAPETPAATAPSESRVKNSPIFPVGSNRSRACGAA
jgi:hypothetical protein